MKSKKYMWIITLVIFVIIFSCVKMKTKDYGNEKEPEGIEIGNEVAEKEENESSEEPTPDVELTQQADAEYEKWLAATMIVAVSMEYPGFEDIQIYTESSTTLENKAESNGVYALFTESGTTMAIHSKAIPDERSEKGTKDISSQALGFATFDQIDAGQINRNAMTEIELVELEELIKQSLLVSVYSH